MPISNRQLNEPNTYHLNIINTTLTNNLGPMESNIGILVDNSIINNSNLSTIASDTTNILVDTSNLTVQLDNLTRIAGVDNYSENVTTGLSVLGAVRNDTQASLVSSNKDLTFLQVDSNGALYTYNTSPTNAIGTQGNTANARTTVVPNEKTTAIDLQYCSHCSVFGTVSGGTTITVQCSQDGANFYSTSYTYTSVGAESFYIDFDAGFRYAQLLVADTGITITATIAAKQ